MKKTAILIFLVILLTENAFAWWNFNWALRRPIIINNTANPNTLTDYQVAINLTYDADMQPDFSDIRFTYYNSTNNTETEIPYWIENKVNSAWAYVWVKVPQIPASSYTTIYVYYKNTTIATSRSNASTTLEFYDDFSTDSRSRYVGINAVLSYDATNKYMVIQPSSVPYGALVIGKTLRDLEIFAMMAISSGGGDTWGGIVARSYSQTSLAYHYYLGDKPTATTAEKPIISKCMGGGRTQLVGQNNAQSTGVFYNFTFRVYGNTLWAMSSKTNQTLSTTDTSFTGAGYFGFGTCIEAGYMAIKLVKVRKYTSPEPTTNIGSEEYSSISITLYSPQNEKYYQNYILINVSVNSTATIDEYVEIDEYAEYLNNYLIFSTNPNSTTYSRIYNLTVNKTGTYNFTVFAKNINNQTDTKTIIFNLTGLIKFNVFNANGTALTNYLITIQNSTHSYTYFNINEIDTMNLPLGWLTFVAKRDLFDNETKTNYLNNDEALFENYTINFTLYRLQHFYFYDKRANKFENYFFVNDYFSNQNYQINISLRELCCGLKNLTAWKNGFIENTTEINFTLNSELNFTFISEKATLMPNPLINEVKNSFEKNYKVVVSNGTYSKEILIFQDYFDKVRARPSCLPLSGPTDLGGGVYLYRMTGDIAVFVDRKQTTILVPFSFTYSSQCTSTSGCYKEFGIIMYVNGQSVASRSLYCFIPYLAYGGNCSLDFTGTADLSVVGSINNITYDVYAYNGAPSSLCIKDILYKEFDKEGIFIFDNDLPLGRVLLQVNNDSYIPRNYIAYNHLKSHYVLEPVLLSISDGLAFRIKVVDEMLKEIPNATITARKYINVKNKLMTVEQGITDDFGSALMSFRPYDFYNILAIDEKGKVCKETNLQPSSAEIWIKCNRTTDYNYKNVYEEDLKISLLPRETEIRNNTRFELKVHSDKGLLSHVCMKIFLNDTYTLFYQCSSYPSDNVLFYNLDINQFDKNTKIYLTYSVSYNDTELVRQSNYYVVVSEREILKISKNISEGAGRLGSFIIASIATFAVAGFVSRFSLVGAGMIAGIMMLVFAYLGFVELYIALLIMFAGISLAFIKYYS